jgi:hypothetical protein
METGRVTDTSYSVAIHNCVHERPSCCHAFYTKLMREGLSVGVKYQRLAEPRGILAGP